MTDKEKNLTLKWIKCWQNASRKLEQIRCDKIRNSVTSWAIKNLNDAFNASVKMNNSKQTSGLVQQQKLFRKLRK